ncbi:ABC transporter ATP-binding protein [Candidatus Laterigemmans baculatus]|uniref:ABC transporter ATP-binding protein n=1 Tax=Candidatus Laterigemmans baculatus TaxID=2770505 RepID=UPI0013DC1A4A|nr:ABC transporter ATP-binding protein [Candidatus Laterigemmans baculatus]
MPTLLAQHLAKSYPTPSQPLVVLSDISFSMERGESLAIVGPSGCGKSTLLNLLGALDRPTSGRFELSGTDPAQLNEAALARFRNEQIGFIFQDHHLLPQLTVLENVLVPALAAGRPDAGATARARQLLDRVGLSDRLSHIPGELSGGQKERVAVARALLNQPTLVLADEPTGNLDRSTAESIATLLKELQQEQNTLLIVVTHSESLAAQMDSQRELIDGRLEEVAGSR